MPGIITGSFATYEVATEVAMSNIYDNAIKAIRILLLVVVVLSAFYVAFRLGNFITGLGIYYWLAHKLVNEATIPEYVAKAVSVLIAGLLVAYGWQIVKSFLKGQKRFALGLAGALTVFFLAMAVSDYRFAPEELFSSFGKPLASYVTLEDGTIKKVPLSWKFDKATGLAAKPFDEETAKKYRGQKVQPVNKVASSNKNELGVCEGSWPRYYDEYDDTLTCLFAVGITEAPDRTIIHLAVHGRNGESGLLWPSEKSRTYLVDQRGATYNIVSDTAWYSSFFRHNLYNINVFYRTIREEEVYRFDMTFQPFKSNPQSLKLYHDVYQPLDLTLLLSKMGEAPSLPLPQPQIPPVEASPTIKTVEQPPVGAPVYSPKVRSTQTWRNWPANSSKPTSTTDPPPTPEKKLTVKFLSEPTVTPNGNIIVKFAPQTPTQNRSTSTTSFPKGRVTVTGTEFGKSYIMIHCSIQRPYTEGRETEWRSFILKDQLGQPYTYGGAGIQGGQITTVTLCFTPALRTTSRILFLSHPEYGAVEIPINRDD